jgi:hypothetical protein
MSGKILQCLDVNRDHLNRIPGKLSFVSIFPPSHDRTENVHRNRKDDGAVVLCRDAAQSLEITQLKWIRIIDMF